VAIATYTYRSCLVYMLLASAVEVQYSIPLVEVSTSGMLYCYCRMLYSYCRMHTAARCRTHPTELLHAAEIHAVWMVVRDHPYCHASQQHTAPLRCACMLVLDVAPSTDGATSSTSIQAPRSGACMHCFLLVAQRLLSWSAVVDVAVFDGVGDYSHLHHLRQLHPLQVHCTYTAVL